MNQSHAGTRLRVVLGHLSQRLAGVGVSFAVRAARAASVVASRALGTAAQRTLPLPARPRPGVGVSCSGRPRAGRQRSRGRRVPSADSPKLPAGGPACSLGGRVTVPASGAAVAPPQASRPSWGLFPCLAREMEVLPEGLLSASVAFSALGRASSDRPESEARDAQSQSLLNWSAGLPGAPGWAGRWTLRQQRTGARGGREAPARTLGLFFP